jgi:hypothetical protein
MKNTSNIEEAANLYMARKGNISTTKLEDAIFRQGFLDGALSESAKKYHQEEMYSEVEVKELIKKAVEFYSDYKYLPLGTWFNEHKKK